MPLRKRSLAAFILALLVLARLVSFRLDRLTDLPAVVPADQSAEVRPPPAATRPSGPSTTPAAATATATRPPPTAAFGDTITPSPPAATMPTAMPLPTATASPTPSPQPTVTATPAPTMTPSLDRLQLPPLNLVPGDPIPYLETFRLLSFYGSPAGWGLGILAESPRDQMTQSLLTMALRLQRLSPDRFVLPTYHLVTTMATGFPGADEAHAKQVDLEILEEWLQAAAGYGCAVVLDLQPGRRDLQVELDRIKPLLYRPHVHLALDPEFVVAQDQVPGQHLGQLGADQVNAIQTQLEEIALEIGLNRLLILHQFEDEMLPDKARWVDYPHVELVIDADGVSHKWNKLYDYNQYVAEPGFEYAGIKIFFRQDQAPLLTLEELVALVPPPAVIIYQ